MLAAAGSWQLASGSGKARDVDGTRHPDKTPHTVACTDLRFVAAPAAVQEAAAAAVVRGMSPSARLVYALGGAQKFELPVGEAGVDSIFRRMEQVKARCAL